MDANGSFHPGRRFNGRGTEVSTRGEGLMDAERKVPPGEKV
jgi:hypothetical protein